MIEVCQRLGKRAGEKVRATSIKVAIGIFRIELDGLVAVGDGLISVAFAEVGPAAVAVGLRKFRIELDRLRVVGYGPIEVARDFVGEAAIVARSKSPLSLYALPRLS